MDAFEQLVAGVLWSEGYWVRTSVKVDLTKEEKREIKRPSSPRWELDIVAFKGKTNTLHVVECKSYIDSVGVQASGFRQGSKNSARYKLFTDATLRRVVFNRLAQDFSKLGLCRAKPKVRLCLAAGKIQKKSREVIAKLFEQQDWTLWDERWLASKLRALGRPEVQYENEVASVVAKLILRNADD